MAYTATINSLTEIGERLRVVVTISDGTGSKTVEIWGNTPDCDPAWLKLQVQREIRKHENFVALLALGTGVYDVTPAVVTPTPAEIAKATYAAQLTLAYQAKSAVGLGIIEATNADYLALLAWLKTNFQTGYLDLFNRG